MANKKSKDLSGRHWTFRFTFSPYVIMTHMILWDYCTWQHRHLILFDQAMDLIWAGFEDDGEMKYDHGFECLWGGWWIDFWEKKTAISHVFRGEEVVGRWVESLGPLGLREKARSSLTPWKRKNRWHFTKDDNPDVGNFSCLLCVMRWFLRWNGNNMLLVYDFRMCHSDSNCSIPTAGCATRIKMKMALNSKFPDQQIRTETQGFCCFFSPGCSGESWRNSLEKR